MDSFDLSMRNISDFGRAREEESHRDFWEKDRFWTDDVPSGVKRRSMKSVVVFLPFCGRVLAVSRGKDFDDVNMPGGMVEDGEPTDVAAIRELWEETGIIADEIRHVFTALQGKFEVSAYKVDAFHGVLKSSWEGAASWELPDALESSTFAPFFKKLMSTLTDDEKEDAHRLDVDA